MRDGRTVLAILCAAAAISATASAAAETVVSLRDPTGDDNGPGSYVYPTESVYAPGAFDITAFDIDVKGGDVVFKVTVRSKVDDPWDSKSWPGGGNGFSLQFVQVYIDTDHKDGSGFRDGLPGLNVRFQPASAWEKVVLLSPQNRARLQAEVGAKAPSQKSGVVIPKSTRVQGKTIIATVDAKDLGGSPAKGWGYAVLMQSNEGFPASSDLLTRKVNELAGQHRFGGGSDWECDPHVIDLVAAPGKGGADEAQSQHAQLKYACDAGNPDGSPKVELPLIYP